MALVDEERRPPGGAPAPASQAARTQRQEQPRTAPILEILLGL